MASSSVVGGVALPTASNAASAAVSSSDAQAGADVIGTTPAPPTPEQQRMLALKAKLDAATTDEQRINAYKEIADSAPTSDAEKRDLFTAMADRLTPEGKENMKRFFAAVSAQAAAPQPVTYTVAKGDSVSKIASKYGVSTQELYEANKDKIGKPYVKNGVTYMMIHPGQVLTIPGKGQQAAAPAPAAPAESPEAAKIAAQKTEVEARIAEADKNLAKYSEQRSAAVSQDVIQIIDQSISQTKYDKAQLEDMHRELQQKYDEQKARDRGERPAAVQGGGASTPTTPGATTASSTYQSPFKPATEEELKTKIDSYMAGTFADSSKSVVDSFTSLYGW